MSPSKFIMPRHKEPTPEEKEAEFSETTPIRTNLGFLLTIGGVLIVACTAWIGMSQRVEAEADARKEFATATVKKQAETEERVKTLEKASSALALDVATVRNDVAWMRQRMEEDRFTRRPNP